MELSQNKTPGQFTFNPIYSIFVIYKLFPRTLSNNFPNTVKTLSQIQICPVLQSTSKFLGVFFFSSIKTDKSSNLFSYIQYYLVSILPLAKINFLLTRISCLTIKYACIHIQALLPWFQMTVYKDR